MFALTTVRGVNFVIRDSVCSITGSGICLYFEHKSKFKFERVDNCGCITYCLVLPAPQPWYVVFTEYEHNEILNNLNDKMNITTNYDS